MSNHNRNIFYCGVCNNIDRRVIEHKHEFGSIFTKKYKLKYLVYYEEYQFIQDAISREKEIKNGDEKRKLI